MSDFYKNDVIEIDKIIPFAANARTHSENQVAQIAANIRRFGFTNPVLIDENFNLIAGHGRLLAARKLNFDSVPAVVVTGLTENERRALVIADNKLALNAGWDEELLAAELADLADDFSELMGFSEDELLALLNAPADPKEEKNLGGLAERFLAPPFSVLDTTQGYWTQRRAQWLELTGNLTESKEGVLSDQDSLMGAINNGSSNFDPVLAEIMMTWFSAPNGKIIDPFGGEQTKGVVAGHLGRTYNAVEFRQDQVDINQNACRQFDHVVYKCGDSNDIAKHYTDRDYNLCFTSPPYYDLEVYSADDMSALGTYEEFMASYENIFRQCVEMLEDDSWLVIKIGEIRNKKTGIYRNFLGDNIAMFLRLGLNYYNEVVLLNAYGTAPQRAAKTFKSRKMVKVHQNVLVFCKGDPKKAAAKCGDVEVMEVE